ncbi:amidohydrolase [Aureococcus anophagefferens]|nr:amidohydrolase [Aureococcus anophagefferens]
MTSAFGNPASPAHKNRDEDDGAMPVLDVSMFGPRDEVFDELDELRAKNAKLESENHALRKAQREQKSECDALRRKSKALVTSNEELASLCGELRTRLARRDAETLAFMKAEEDGEPPEIIVDTGSITVNAAGTVDVTLQTKDQGDLKLELVLPPPPANKACIPTDGNSIMEMLSLKPPDPGDAITDCAGVARSVYDMNPAELLRCLDCVPRFRLLAPAYKGSIMKPNRDSLYDAHAHMIDFYQRTEGIEVLAKEMDACGVTAAAVMGNPLKKRWSEFEPEPSADAFNDTDTMFYYSATDVTVVDAIGDLPPDVAVRFAPLGAGKESDIPKGSSLGRFPLAPLMCGFDPTDRFSADQVKETLASPKTDPKFWRGLGQFYLRNSEITNLTLAQQATPTTFGFERLMATAQDKGLPVVLLQNAQSESVKPYKRDYCFIPELEACLASRVRVLWVGCGIFCRGNWGGYVDRLREVLPKHRYLCLSITPQCLLDQPSMVEGLVELCDEFPTKFMLGSSTMGKFTGAYAKDWAALRAFADRCAPETRERLLFKNAQGFYDDPSKANEEQFPARQSVINKPKNARNRLSVISATQKAPDWLNRGAAKQKSSGTRTILEAMDGCGCDKAVLIGMPCCKKWSKDEPEALYYQDDNGQLASTPTATR